MHSGIFLTFFFLITFGIYAQQRSIDKTCNCISKPQLSEVIDCNQILFTNGAKIYRQYNCNKSWLTFESKNGKKRVLYSLEQSLLELTGKLGYQFLKEYPKVLLFENRQASGGGFPVNHELLNKEDGTIIQKLGSILYFSNNSTNNFVLKFNNISQDTLAVYFVDDRTNILSEIRMERMDKSLSLFELVDEPKIVDDKLKVRYTYLSTREPDIWKNDSIVIDLAKPQILTK